MVWHSSESSIQNREISFLAILEIVFATFLYWGIAFYYDFYLHIITSIFFAPFLLLKSKDSMIFTLNKCVIIFSKNSLIKFTIDNKIMILLSSLMTVISLYFTNNLNNVLRFLFAFFIGVLFSNILIILFVVLYSKILATLKYFIEGIKSIGEN